MASVNGATLLARTLQQAALGPVFTLSGHQILPVYDAGLDADLRFVDTRHEAAAVHMADAYARLTERPTVALVTAAPGHANALTAVATANMSESPVLLLSGGTDTSHVGKGGFQEMDQIGMIEPICKGAWVAPSAAELPRLVARALRTAVSGVPGPVHITLPYDVLHQQVDEADIHLPTAEDFEPSRRQATAGAIGRAIDLLATAQRPMLLAGPSAWRGATGQQLQSLLDLVGMPALLIDSAVGLGEPSIHGLGSELARADLIFLLTPQDFTINFAAAPIFPQGVPIVQAAPRQAEIGRNRRVDVSLVGDQASVVAQLLTAAQARTWPSTDWRTQIDDLREERRAATSPFENVDDVPLHPQRVVSTVRDLLRPGDSVALDGGEFVRWARWTFGGGPYELVTSGKLGALGSGIPFANAAALARPDRRSVAFIGDGTFGFHGMELDTAVRHNLPSVVIVGNDAGWATERHRQRAVYGPDRLVAADLLPTRYDVVAQGLGAHGELVERPEQLRPALERAFAGGKPACINVMIASLRAPATGA